MGRYQVCYPIEIAGTSPGSSDDLEEAGQIYLTAKASDIWDSAERRWIHPEMEIDCVGRAYQKWYRRQQRRRIISRSVAFVAGSAGGVLALVTAETGPATGMGVGLGLLFGLEAERKLKRRWAV